MHHELKIGDLVRLNTDIYPPETEIFVQLTSVPLGLVPQDSWKVNGVFSTQDLGTVIEFSDCSKLSVHIYTPNGFGWIAVAQLERVMCPTQK